MRRVGGTPLLVCPDLLGSTADVGALGTAVRGTADCGASGMLAGAGSSDTCAEADGRVLGCKRSGIGLEAGDSCGIAMGDSPGDRGEAGGVGSIDQSERRMGDSGGDCRGDEIGEAMGERSGTFTSGTAMSRRSGDEGMSSVSEGGTGRLGEFCMLISMVSPKVSSRPRRWVSSRF